MSKVKKRLFILLAIIAITLSIVIILCVLFDGKANEKEIENKGSVQSETKGVVKDIVYDYFENWHWGVDDSNVVITDDKGYGYVNNRISIDFGDKEDDYINRVVESIGGKIIGFSETGTYQIEIEKRTLEELRELRKQIWEQEGLSAMYNLVGTTSRKISLPNDKWINKEQDELIDWNEGNPDGLNWWLEAIEAPSAWYYKHRFNNIKIGIVDSGFDNEHEDLNISVINENVAENHGTLVAGIIGAIDNNTKGVTGIVWNKELYTYALNDINLDDAAKSIERLLLNECKIVNISMGFNIKDYDVNEVGAWTIEQIVKWKENPEIGDFIIVQSAGNESSDSIYCGLCASVTEEAMKIYCNNYGSKYSYEDIMQHIMIVGAVDKPMQHYNMSDFSNYGSHVSITAPGRDIFSTIVMGGKDGNYGADKGTSFAAPIVTGVVALVWSINENFSASEVKDIVCNYTNKTATGYGNDTRKYPIVNAYLAVKEAIRRTDEIGVITGFVREDITNIPLEGVIVSATVGQAGYSVITDKNGKFELSIPEGDYELMLNCDGYLSKTIKQNSNIDVENVLLDTIYLTPTSNLMGYIIDAETNTPVKDASILLQQIDEGGMIVEEFTCLTDANGQFTLNVPIGNYEYLIKCDKYEDATGIATVEKADGNIMGNLYLVPKPDIIELKDYIGSDINNVIVKISDLEKTEFENGSIEYKNEFVSFTTSPMKNEIAIIRIYKKSNYSVNGIKIGDNYNSVIDNLENENWKADGTVGIEGTDLLYEAYYKDNCFMSLQFNNNVVDNIECSSMW